MGTTVQSLLALSSPKKKFFEPNKKKEVDAIEFAFDVYDFKGDGKVDAFYAGDLIRACNLNPPSRPSLKSEEPLRRDRRCSPRLMSSPCTRPARTPRTREVSMTSLRS